MKMIKLICIAMISTGLLSGCDRTRTPGDSAGYGVSILPYTNSVYNNKTNGPSYIAIQVTNTGTPPLAINSLSLDTNGPSSISVSTESGVYLDKNSTALNACSAGISLNKGQSCYIFIHSDKNYPQLMSTAGHFDQKLIINTSQGQQTIDVYSQGFLYIVGEFKKLGDASATGSDYLLAKCGFVNNTNQLSCINPFDSATRNENGYTYAVTTDSAGNIYMGGNFDTIGGLLTSNGTILAKFNPTNHQITNPFADSDNPSLVTPYQDNVPNIKGLAFDSNNKLYITGIMNAVGGATPAAQNDPDQMGYILAQCDISQSGDSKCTNLLTAYGQRDDINYNEVQSLATYNNYIIGNGQIDMIGGISVNFTSSCTISGNAASNCGQLVATAPNNYVWTTTVDSNNNLMYTGGTFTRIDSAINNAPFLAKCTLSPSTGTATCADDALGAGVHVSGGKGPTMNTFVGASALDNNGNIFIAGKFDTIANGAGPIISTTGSGGNNLIARCKIDGSSCTDLLAGTAVDGADDSVHGIVINVESTAIGQTAP